MPNQLQLNGAQPPRPSRKAPLYQGARFSSGLWTNRSALRDAASSRYEERYIGPRGDAFLGGENLEISQKLTLVRRPGSSVWNSNNWTNVNSFYEFRLFNANTEEIKTMVDTKTALYNASNNGQVSIWNKSPYSNQSYMQSVGNILFWGDSANQKKWINTLQTRIPYSTVLTDIAEFPQNAAAELNPYNFTPFDLSSFVIDSNGNAQQLIETVLQLSSFYVLNSTLVVTLKPTDSLGNPLPTASQVLTSGLEVYFPSTSTIATALGGSAFTATVQNIVGGIKTASIYFGGSGYAVNDVVNLNQTNPAGSKNGQVKVLTTGTSAGTGYTTATAVPTTTREVGSGCTLNITASGGGLVSATVAAGGINYAIGDYLFPVQAGSTGGYFKVTGVAVNAVTSVALCTGVATSISIQTAGEGYFTSSNVPTLGGTGSGMSVNITDDGTQFSAPFIYSGGSATNASVSVSGTGYAVGDNVFPVVPSGSSATGAKFQVASIYGVPATLTLTYGGPSFTGYTVASGLATTTSGSGSAATFNILTVSSGQIATYSIGSGGTGYAVGDTISPVQATGAGALYSVSTVSSGAITGLTQISGGYLPYSVATNVPTTTSGSGTGLTVDISTVSSAAITAGVIHTAGTGYKIGDRVYPTQAGTSGTAYFTVATLTAATGGVASLTTVTTGTGYTSGSYATTTSGTGTGLTITLVVNNASFFPDTATSDIPSVYIGGNPISSYTPNASFTWNPTVGGTTIDGSALWINRGSAVDNGLVYNWGLSGGTIAPTAVVNGAISGWTANTYYNYWQFIIVTVSGNKYVQQLVKSGISGGTAPSWSTTAGQITTDGNAEWVCLSNDGDKTLTWAASTSYSVGHVLEATPVATPCVYQLQPYTGIMTAGNNFPVYVWQCNSQSGADVGAAGEIPNGVSGNLAMAPNGTQPTSTANASSTMNSLFISYAGASGSPNYPQSYAIDGAGLLGSSGTQIFSGNQNLSISMLPELVIPAAGTYTFYVGHQSAMFFGVGKGSITLNITQVQVNNNILVIKCDRDISSLVTVGVNLTFAGVTNASFLNGQTVTITNVSGKTFSASFTHGNYGPGSDTGTASSGSNLVPTQISGALNWAAAPKYDFSTGTPIKGYTPMYAYYGSSGGTFYSNTVQISFPAAGVYPAEFQYGIWYHSVGGSPTYPTTSPALPAISEISFYVVYSPPGSATKYNIIPQGIACSSGTSPTFPDWPSNLAGMQALAPAYPSVVETSGNYTWWNLGPVTTFNWNASVNQTTATYIVDGSGNKEIPYEAGVSGTSQPTFGTILYQLASDLTPLVWMNDGPAGTVVSGTLSTTQGGWKYCVSLVNTLDNTVSNASPVSLATGSFFEASGVFISGGLPEVIDPQADYVAIFRTQDGGSTYYLIPPPVTGNGNTEYTLPLSQYLTQGFTDTNIDTDLQTLFQAPLALQNSPPPKGSINLAFQDGRIFVSYQNVVQWSTGPDTPVGNGYNGFDPSNYAVFPSLVKRLVPLNIGMLVFTVSDIYLISGNGTANNPFNSRPFIQKVGLLSYNALTVNGSIVYFMSTDLQVLEINTHYGLTGIGFPIADIFQNFDPSASYLTWHVNGSNDQCLFVADGSTGWYRMSPTPAPETGTATWSLKANIVGGCGAVQSVETSPGNIQALLGPPPGITGPILFRDYNNFQDGGAEYPANFILGSVVMAYPGQVATPDFITTDCLRVPNSRPIALGVRIGEVSGNFEDLIFWTNDPPQLPPSESMFNQRFYLSQTQQSVLCRHMQIYGEFQETNSADELNTITVYGGFNFEG